VPATLWWSPSSAAHTKRDLDAVAATLNSRPGRTLGWKPPAEALDGQLEAAQQVLHRPLEPAQYTSIALTSRLLEAGIDSSVGSVHDPLDNALAETAIGSFKIEQIQRNGP